MKKKLKNHLNNEYKKKKNYMNEKHENNGYLYDDDWMTKKI